MPLIIHIARPSAQYIIPVVVATVKARYPHEDVRLCGCPNHDPYLKPMLVMSPNKIVNNVTFKKHIFSPIKQFKQSVYCNICCKALTRGYQCVEPTHDKIHLGKYYSGYHVCQECKLKIDDHLPIAVGVPAQLNTYLQILDSNICPKGADEIQKYVNNVSEYIHDKNTADWFISQVQNTEVKEACKKMNVFK